MPLTILQGSRYTPSDALSAIQINPGSNSDYGYARLDTLPNLFGDGEFAFEMWVKATQGITVASTASVKTNRWSSDNSTIYGASDWWFLGNFIVDGHNNGTFENGTFSLQVTNSGRVQWTFGDGTAAGVRTGDLHGLRGTTAILDDAWHHICCVRRWDGGTGAVLELWVDGVMEDSETSTARTNMATSYWDSWSGYPANQDNWFFGAEKQAGLGSIEWEHWMGMIDEVRFYSRAPTTTELENEDITSGLVGRYAFNEGTGTSVSESSGGASMTLVDADQYEWVEDGVS